MAVDDDLAALHLVEGVGQAVGAVGPQDDHLFDVEVQGAGPAFPDRHGLDLGADFGRAIAITETHEAAAVHLYAPNVEGDAVRRLLAEAVDLAGIKRRQSRIDGRAGLLAPCQVG